MKPETLHFNKISRFLIINLFLTTSHFCCWGQLSITTNGTAFSIDFTTAVSGVNNGTFAGTGFEPTPASGRLDSDAWAINGMSEGNLAFGGTFTTGDYARGTSIGAIGTGGFYAFNVGGGNIALGIQPIGDDWTPGTLTLRIQNNTGTTITNLEISYDIFVYNDQGRSNSFNFSRSADNMNYLDIASLNYSSPEAAGATPTWAATNRSIVITGLSITDGNFYYLRWSGDDISGSGSRDEFALDNISITSSSVVTATYTWTAASDDWINAANWTPVRNSPAASDVIVFNQGGNVLLTNVPSETIGRLLVSNNSNLTLRATTGATRTLTIQGGDGNDLLINTGSTLTIDSDDAMEISLATGATGSISGNINFSNLIGGGISRYHRLLASDAGAITFNTGAICHSVDLSGNLFGETGNTNTVVFANGSTYISEDGGNPFGFSAPDSKISFQSGSKYVHKQASPSIPSLAGRIYADFELDAAGTVNILLGSTSNPNCTINNMTIKNGTINFVYSTNNLPLNIFIKENLEVQAGATFNFSPTETSATSTFKFNGTANQAINTGAGTITFGNNAILELDNTNGLTFRRDVDVNGSVLLTNGDINLNNNDLNLGAIGSIAENLTSNHLIKDLTATTDANPGGKIIAANRTIDASVSNIAGLGVELSTTGSNYTVDIQRYHYQAGNGSGIKKTHFITGTPTAATTMKIVYANDEIPTDLDEDDVFALFRYDNILGWENKGGIHDALNNHITVAGVTQFSPWAVGSTAVALPIRLLSFEVYKNSDNQAELSWQTAIERNNKGFEIQKSINVLDFEAIAFVDGADNSNQIRSYKFIDRNFEQSSYYRLKQIDFDEKFAFSPIVFLAIDEGDFFDICPNPVQNLIKLSIPNTTKDLEIALIDFQGKITFQQKTSKEALENYLTNQLNLLKAGFYLLRLKTEKQVFYKKIIKL